jgi:hypothetical protein
MGMEIVQFTIDTNEVTKFIRNIKKLMVARFI